MALFYITRDVERAAGLLGIRNDYYLITNPSPLAEGLQEKYGDQLVLMERHESLSTLSLMRGTSVQKKVRELSTDVPPTILVFKNSHQIELECKNLGWRLINPSAALSGKIENKISQYAWLRERKSQCIEAFTPLSVTGEIGQYNYKFLVDLLGEGFVMQYNIGHTGSGTKRIINEQEWKSEEERFPKRMVKISKYIEGTMYTMNACVVGENVVCGHTSKQITGAAHLTNNPLATVGNDWSAVHQDVHDKVARIASEMGRFLIQDGWKGLFGIDVIIGTHDDAGPGHIIEINARQPASSTMESQLQMGRGEVSLMERHVGALSQNTKHKTQNHGAPPGQLKGYQLFFRNIENRAVQLNNEVVPGRYRLHEQGIEFVENATSVAETKPEEIFAFSVSKNASIKPGGELLRIQAKNGMIDAHGKNCNGVISRIRRTIEIT